MGCASILGADGGAAQWGGMSARTDSCASATDPKWRHREGWVQKPRLRTRRELLAERKRALLPDQSFDVDGDGVVSAQVRPNT